MLKHWDALLGDLEFSCNNSVSATAGRAPFFLSLGHHPKALEDVALAPPLSSITANYLLQMSTAIRSAQASIRKASLRSQCYANQKRRSESFAEGDEALLSTADISLPAPEDRAKKLLPKRIGPFITSPPPSKRAPFFTSKNFAVATSRRAHHARLSLPNQTFSPWPRRAGSAANC